MEFLDFEIRGQEDQRKENYPLKKNRKVKLAKELTYTLIRAATIPAPHFRSWSKSSG
jgi:hypothetical protein